AIGVAAHECGLAVQDHTNYVPLRLRAAIVPVANFGSTISFPLILIGVLFSWNQTLINIGILAFSLALIFQLVTLPVEFNA
ncbi:zinc metallopeptidase, partial [Enterococcus faecalis]|uniref:zinc metallopeptidase n=1 Tax=Enterococcus faecalis TaxID=1351 RepID=UPI003CC676C0